MRELRLVAVSADGQHLLVGIEDPDGEQFRLEIDDRLRAAAVRRPSPPDQGHPNSVRPASVPPGQPAARPQSALTPREIQARLRAGESVEDIAGAAGVPVDRITRFEGPVIAERELRITEAQAATPHRAAGSPHEPMGTLADAFLDRERVETESVRWNAWLDADGSWRVELAYAVGGRARSARWSWDVGRYHLAPLDKAAGMIAEPPPDPSPLPRPARPQPESVPQHDPWAVPDEATDAAVAAVAAVAESAANAEAPAPPDAELSAATPPAPAAQAPPAPAAQAPLSVEEELSELGRLAVAVAAVSLPTHAAAARESEPPAEQPPPPDPRPTPAAARGPRRASVPSWDDILLGTRPQH